MIYKDKRYAMEKRFYKSIGQMPLADREECLISHGLLAHYYKYFPKNCSPLAKSTYINQWHHNQFLKDQAAELIKNLELKEYVLLKGLALFDDIYIDIAERTVSDIDFWIPNGQLNEIHSKMYEMGYQYVSPKRWYGNEHKREYQKRVGDQTVVVEFHEKIFFHLSENIIFGPQKNSNGHLIPRPEEHFVFMCGHYGHQHTYQRMVWLLDLIYYWEKYPLNEELIFQLAKQWKVQKSLQQILYIISYYTDRDLSQNFGKPGPLTRWALDDSFLWNTKQWGLKYWCLKVSGKDSIREFIYFAYKKIRNKYF